MITLISKRNVVLCFFLPADLHECCLAWLGHSHVTLPGYPALVLKLPHCQVKYVTSVGTLILEKWPFCHFFMIWSLNCCHGLFDILFQLLKCILCALCNKTFSNLTTQPQLNRCTQWPHIKTWICYSKCMLIIMSWFLKHAHVHKFIINVIVSVWIILLMFMQC